MPWSYPSNVPSVAKNKSAKEQKACVSAANDEKAKGKSDSEAIQACIGAMKGVKDKKQEAEMPTGDTQELGAKENAAQQARSKRYRISIRDDGNVTKPSKWSHVADSQWGDPVNYLYPVPDKSHAQNAKSRFAQNKSKYGSSSRAVVRRRLNRLCRKYGVDPIEKDDDHENNFDNGVLVGEIFLQNDDDLPEDDPHRGMVRIPAARTGQFTRRVWFWKEVIDLDDDLFESFVDNWQTGVVGTDLFIADGHRHDQAALAWVKDMQIEDGNFVLYAKPTELGEALGDGYRYASLWFTSNFRDQETQIEYGPTLLGCAATNIPFIHRQEPMSVVMSADGQQMIPHQPPANNFIFVYDNTNALTVSADDVQPEPDAQDDAGLENSSEEETMSDKDTKETSQTLHVGDREFTEEDIQKMLGEQQQTETRNAKLELELQKAKVEELCNTASARGVAPIVVETARQILMACDMVAEPSIALTVRDDGEDKEEKVNLFNAAAHMLSVVPGRIGDDPELTYSKGNDDAPPKSKSKDGSAVLYTEGDEDMTPEQAEELARERRQKLGIKTQDDAEL